MRVTFLSVSLFFWLIGCVLISDKKSPDLFANQWAPYIAFLNQEPRDSTLLSWNIADDPVKTYHHEKRLITQEWQKLAREKLDSVTENRQKNEFFHNAFNQLNNTMIDELSSLHSNLYTKSHHDLAAAILYQVETNPVTSTKNIYAYQQGNHIGFCFARALLVHYLLLDAGVAQEDILKVFAVGDFHVSGQFWQFHMATMVKDKIHGFLVVDPLQGKILSLKDWISSTKQIEIKHPFSHARFYVSDARKFMPHSGMYDPILFSQPELKPFFHDLVLQIAKLTISAVD